MKTSECEHTCEYKQKGKPLKTEQKNIKDTKTIYIVFLEREGVRDCITILADEVKI